VRIELPFEATSAQDKTWRKRENTQEFTLTKFLYSKFNVSLQEARYSIYRYEALGEQERRERGDTCKENSRS